MPRLLALNAEWRRNPPLPLMIKAFMGIKDAPHLDSANNAPTQIPDFED